MEQHQEPAVSTAGILLLLRMRAEEQGGNKEREVCRAAGIKRLHRDKLRLLNTLTTLGAKNWILFLEDFTDITSKGQVWIMARWAGALGRKTRIEGCFL